MALGVKVTCTAQVLPGVSELQVVLAAENWEVACTLLICTGAVPVLAIVIVCTPEMVFTAVDEKLKLDGLIAMLGGPGAPDPVSETECGLPWASSTIVRVPVRVPTPVGVNVIVNVQEDAGATVVPQSSVSAKSPLIDLLAIDKDCEPILRRRLVCEGLVVPIDSELNCNANGAMATAGAAVTGSILAMKESVGPPHTV